MDLSSVPIVDLLEFRQQHAGEYQRYASNVRMFADEVASTPEPDRGAILQERRNELASEADRLVHIARTWWRQPAASVSLGLAGAVLAGTCDGNGGRDACTARLFRPADEHQPQAGFLQPAAVAGSEPNPVRNGRQTFEKPSVHWGCGRNRFRTCDPSLVRRVLYR
jgi:hypothetical protein